MFEICTVCGHPFLYLVLNFRDYFRRIGMRPLGWPVSCCSAGHTERSQAFVLDGMRSAFCNLFYGSVSFTLLIIYIYFYVYFYSIMYFR